jgi:glycosyltransferase involved in cell wall biosynthesis
MKSLRIAFLTPQYARGGLPNGGLANYLLRICLLLKKHEHKPMVFLLGDHHRKTESNGIRIVVVKRNRLNAFNVTAKLEGVFKFIELWLNARHIARAFHTEHSSLPFDLIQSTSHMAVGNALIGRIHIPLIVRVSSYAPLWRAAQGQPATFQNHLCDWPEIFQLQRADALFAPSRLLSSYLSRTLNVSVEVIPSPFLIPQEPEDESLYRKLLEAKRYLLFFGKLHRRKGADVLAKALPTIFEAFPEIHVVFAGRDHSQIRLGKTIGAYALEKAGRRHNQVHLLGDQPHSRLLPILKNAELVVLPSRMDNYPNTCLEAQAFGKIVIGSKYSSLDEMIQDGTTGFLSEPGSPESLAAAICKGLSLTERCRTKFEGAVRSAIQERDEHRLVTNLTNFYMQVISNYNRGETRSAPLTH